MGARKILLVVHPTRPEASEYAMELTSELTSIGFEVLSHRDSEIQLLDQVEIAIVLGGDGTILRAAELIRGTSIPILGINLGNVGFLAEITKPSIPDLISCIRGKTYRTESRLVLHYEVERDSKVIESGWALNEVTVVRTATQMVELFLQIDGRPLSHWGCDGVICATPTGSTAYAFSAGGPVLWPEVPAIVLLPLAAHALFSRPMVVSPDSRIVIDVESSIAELSADGMRDVALQNSDRVTITRDDAKIYLAHIEDAIFTDRLVAKFKLPIEGWRGE